MLFSQAIRWFFQWKKCQVVEQLTAEVDGVHTSINQQFLSLRIRCESRLPTLSTSMVSNRPHLCKNPSLGVHACAWTRQMLRGKDLNCVLPETHQILWPSAKTHGCCGGVIMRMSRCMACSAQLARGLALASLDPVSIQPPHITSIQPRTLTQSRLGESRS